MKKLVEKLSLIVLETENLKSLFSQKIFSDSFKIQFYNFAALVKFQQGLAGSFSITIIDESAVSEEKTSQLDFRSFKTLIVSENLSPEQVKASLLVPCDDVITETRDAELLKMRIEKVFRKYRFSEDQIRNISSSVEEEIKTFHKYDLKTGLYNNETFKNLASQLLKENPDTDYAMAVIDLDHFKVFNEMYGIDAGDKVLEVIGSIFRKYLYDNEIASRVRDDHFMTMIETKHLHPEKVSVLADKMLHDFFPEFTFSTRIGVVEHVNRNEDISLNMTHATIALSESKSDKNSSIKYYDESMSEILKEEQDFLSEMMEGIAKEEFKVYLQPQYDYAADTLIGAEALVRWIHPVKGMIPPVKFIPVFEKNGLVTELDKYVWEQTCKLMRSWLDKGLNPVPVSVNISRRDIYNTNILEYFDSLLQKYRLSSKNLRLEITESAYMENPDQLINVVSELQKRGFCVEMDDFGSGYSSLNTLKDVPVDILKLDMKFIMDCTGNDNTDEKVKNRSGSILSSVVRMANWLQLPVIAEGIESKDQADYLKSIGCFHMQGYYFARPMPAEQYEKLLLELPAMNNEKALKEKSDKAASFLNTSTQATLLFNDFVGAAAIIEWTGSAVEAVRMNDLFFDEIGTTREAYGNFQHNILTRFDGNSRSVFLTNLAEATRTNKQTICELRCLPLNQLSSPFWIRVRIKHLAKTVTSDIFYLAVENINFRMHLLEMNTNLSNELTNIMESVPCGIATMTYKDRFDITFMNESFSRMLKYNPSDFRTKISEHPFFYLGDKKEKVLNFIENAVKTSKAGFGIKTEAFTKDEKAVPVSISGSITLKSDGSSEISLVCVDLNITHSENDEVFEETKNREDTETSSARL